MAIATARLVFHVAPAQGGWEVSHSSDASFHFSKQDAISYAMRTAENEAAASIFVHKKDGSIEAEYNVFDIDARPPVK